MEMNYHCINCGFHYKGRKFFAESDIKEKHRQFARKKGIKCE